MELGVMRRRTGSIVAIALVASAVAYARPAVAYNSFPPWVEKYYMLDAGPVDAMGCKLCHLDDNGGVQNLNSFGTLLHQKYDVKSTITEQGLDAVFAQLEHDQPALADDIRAGRDPNKNTDVPQLPTPDYGCAAAAGPGRAPASPGGVAAALGVVVALAASRSRRR